MNNYEDELIDIELDDREIRLVMASKGKRFANYIIDVIVFYVIVFGLAVVLATVNDNFQNWIIELEETNWFIDRLISAIMLFIYYTIIESTLKGKTIGKYITNTRAVNYDGSVPNIFTILSRSASRIVPFEAFSFLGQEPTGWHDKWSDTIVIDEKESSL